jgi:carboxyl-terminal processing protease
LSSPLLALVLTLQCAQADVSTDDKLKSSTDSTDADIAEVEAGLLQNFQYCRHPFDAEISSRFLDRYLETLDYTHLYFIQSDTNEFEKYRTNLNVLTQVDHDTSPCRVIFSRFMERAKQRFNYATNILATTNFTFTGHDRFIVNRHTLPFAKDMTEAKEFWRQELRCEYLDQLLMAQGIEFSGKMNFETNASGAVTGQISYAWDKAHPLDFPHFPKTLLTQNGKTLATVKLDATGSNAVVAVPWKADAKWIKLTNTFYSVSGQKLGEIRFHHVVTVSFTNSPPVAITNTNCMATIHLNETNLAAITKTLTTRYTQMMDNYKELESDRVFEMYMNALARAYDPHSEYMGHLQAENFAIQMKLSLFGIGAILGKDQDYCKIIELKEGPARKSGQIKANDRIVAVAQSNAEPVDVVGMPLDKIVEMIRGPKGTQVTLTVIPADAAETVHKAVTLVRDEIKLDEQQAKAMLYEVPSTNGSPLKLGVIDLASFYADNKDPQVNTTSDVARLINRLKKENVDGIVLDLRRNGGGYLEQAITLTGLFNPRGPVVQTKDWNGEIVAEPSPETGPLYGGPLVVLTSVFSASASEILAGALQDYGRALMVGDHSTFGKGTVQTIQSLGAIMEQKGMKPSYDPGELKVTIKKFYRAGGVSTQLQGVLSDVEIPSIDDATDVGERSLPNPLPCDSVTPADHLEELQLNRVKPYVAELQSRSHKRVTASKDFDYVREDIAQYRKDQDDKSLSLNEAERRAEQAADNARIEARKKERLARKKSDEKAFEVTLKTLDAPLQLVGAKPNPKAKHEQDLDANGELHDDEQMPDPTMDEARHILADYIELLKKGPDVSVVR